MFRIIHTILETKKGITKPDEFATDISFGMVQGFFITILIILGLLSAISGFIGFYYDIRFFKFLMIFTAILFLVDILFLIVLKKTLGNFTKEMNNALKTKVFQKSRRVIDIEVNGE